VALLPYITLHKSTCVIYCGIITLHYPTQVYVRHLLWHYYPTLPYTSPRASVFLYVLCTPNWLAACSIFTSFSYSLLCSLIENSLVFLVTGTILLTSQLVSVLPCCFLHDWSCFFFSLLKLPKEIIVQNEMMSGLQWAKTTRMLLLNFLGFCVVAGAQFIGCYIFMNSIHATRTDKKRYKRR
jgi:hypothetical protein